MQTYEQFWMALFVLGTVVSYLITRKRVMKVSQNEAAAWIGHTGVSVTPAEFYRQTRKHVIAEVEKVADTCMVNGNLYGSVEDAIRALVAAERAPNRDARHADPR